MALGILFIRTFLGSIRLNGFMEDMPLDNLMNIYHKIAQLRANGDQRLKMTRIAIKDISYFFLYEGSEQFVEIGGGLDDKIAFDDVLIDKGIVVGNDAFEIIDDIDE